MTDIIMMLYAFVLFVLLCPGILLRLPSNGSKLTVAIVHGVVFAILFYLTHKWVLATFYGKEGMCIKYDKKTGNCIQTGVPKGK